MARIFSKTGATFVRWINGDQRTQVLPEWHATILTKENVNKLDVPHLIDVKGHEGILVSLVHGGINQL